LFLDEDVFVVKNLNVYRHYECALGWPENQNMGSQGREETYFFHHLFFRYYLVYLKST